MSFNLSAEQKARLAKLRNAASSSKGPSVSAPKNQPKKDASKPEVKTPAPNKPKNNLKYSDIDHLDISTARSHNDWKDAHFTGIRVYDVVQLTTDQTNLIGKALFKAITEDNVTPEVAYMCLFLAVSVRSTSDVTQLLLHDIGGIMTNKIEREIPSTVEEEDEEEDGISEQQRARLAAAALRRKGTSASQRINKEAASVAKEEDDDMEEVDKDSRAAAYAYIAAFLMRLQCRDVKQVMKTVETAKTRFNGFYDSGGDTLDQLIPSERALSKLKDVFSRRPEITSTWVAWVAYSENEMTLTRQNRGIMEYLALQVFAYQGMHVVVQIFAIHELTKYPIGALLRELDCRMTRAAVQEVYKIVREYQRTQDHPTRKTYYRYSRVWDERYFSKVQSKHCAHLLYLAARTVKDLSPDSTSDPTQIYAVQNMSETMKEQLDDVSARLIGILLSNDDDDEETGTIWKK